MKTLDQPMVKGKPVLIFANKQDKDGAQSSNSLKECLPALFERDSAGPVILTDCTSIPPDVNTPLTDYKPDENIEASITALCKNILEDYDSLKERVAKDSLENAKKEARKRIERERKVLRNKMASAFFNEIPEQVKEELQIEEDPSNIFDAGEGVSFLAAEIGDDVDQLPTIALEICAMSGYQRLALQIIGSLKCPISKKKVPMTWTEIHALLKELRAELHLSEYEVVIENV